MTETNLLQELEQDWQKQRAEELWRRYGRIVIAAAIGVVLVTAIYSWWSQHTQQTRQQATTEFLTILNDQTATANKAEKFTAFADKDSQAGLETLAQLQAAGAIKDVTAKIAAYDAMAKDSKLESQFRELAVLLSVKSQMDGGDAKTLLDALQPLLDKSVWRYSAREYAGHLVLKLGDRAKAREHFTYLAQDAGTPQRIKERADDMARYVAE